MTNSHHRPKVLLLAEYCDPQGNSVPLVGWNLSQALSYLADIHIVTQYYNRTNFINAGLIEGKDFTVIDTVTNKWVDKSLRWIAEHLRGGANKGWTTVMAFTLLISYYFEQQVWQKFKSQIQHKEFDLVHRITQLSPSIPSLMAKKCDKEGVPFIWGPINGGLPWPKDFDAVRRQENEWLSYIRNAYKFVPAYQSTRKHARAILIGSTCTWQQMDSQYYAKCIYLPENAIAAEQFQAPEVTCKALPLKAVFIGRLVALKGVDMLIEAVHPFVQTGQLQVDIIGDGPERSHLASLVKKYAIESGINFTGAIPHQEIPHRLQESDLFIFPSIKEFGGAVVIEAMACGVVPIVMDYGGPGEIVTNTTGYKIPMAPKDTIIRTLHHTLENILADPQSLITQSHQAVQRVNTLFTWQQKAAMIVQVYDWILGHRPDKPDFGMPLSEIPAAEKTLPHKNIVMPVP
ncbi:MAG: glycosyltransferase family 4 protein [Vampirovibrio sp.]|nr:glycosyltransferase family 4 protein [Vampirovibrio sp.]